MNWFKKLFRKSELGKPNIVSTNAFEDALLEDLEKNEKLWRTALNKEAHCVEAMRQGTGVVLTASNPSKTGWVVEVRGGASPGRKMSKAFSERWGPHVADLCAKRVGKQWYQADLANENKLRQALGLELIANEEQES